jgi:hypothetical protein
VTVHVEIAVVREALYDVFRILFIVSCIEGTVRLLLFALSCCPAGNQFYLVLYEMCEEFLAYSLAGG